MYTSMFTFYDYEAYEMFRPFIATVPRASDFEYFHSHARIFAHTVSCAGFFSGAYISYLEIGTVAVKFIVYFIVNKVIILQISNMGMHRS